MRSHTAPQESPSTQNARTFGRHALVALQNLRSQELDRGAQIAKRRQDIRATMDANKFGNAAVETKITELLTEQNHGVPLSSQIVNNHDGARLVPSTLLAQFVPGYDARREFETLMHDVSPAMTAPALSIESLQSLRYSPDADTIALLACARQIIADAGLERYLLAHPLPSVPEGHARIGVPMPTGEALRPFLYEDEELLWHHADRLIDKKPHFVNDQRKNRLVVGSQVKIDSGPSMGRIGTIVELSTIDTAEHAQLGTNSRLPGLTDFVRVRFLDNNTDKQFDSRSVMVSE